MTEYFRAIGDYDVRMAGPQHVEGARRVMLDTFYRDFDYGYQPAWHWDVIDLDGVYLRPARHALFVATLGEEVVGTTAVRAAAPKSPPHPRELVERYPAESTAQLFRVYVRREHRRHGLARAMVEMARRFVARTPGYEAIYLHTDTRVDGAEPFWRSLAVEVYDGRDGDPSRFQTVHFEIPIPSWEEDLLAEQRVLETVPMA
ncbi:Acetyltransferase (GNAT) family protein [Streptoalloteichus tenebrarius]|uniref:Acetyltransferase (GNAT) family protein n=1 Tax=Streptoalloteichus tenebrarius (strain ATCC 17920 / DSM 40477 / JCM 4838 / CBS 697.72 / NBRC 16177 / NCIMB 11028 / NRRL B-12390 / A12253. 1 / ISP 5477) TaxID=1933 RepID=A0ABT1HPC8_STRSD|nr:GNAT family N-acetyltransferase [Streptoalloteichus tenebrarius]MCP2257367.1 Acetyltransferase (GNAT) family protein [Streptoalloteichus tenebrarius]BFF04281.1 GNAT family N-acetyltransferase [Streptoalloteichus tenebrarius]